MMIAYEFVPLLIETTCLVVRIGTESSIGASRSVEGEVEGGTNI